MNEKEEYLQNLSPEELSEYLRLDSKRYELKTEV